MSKQGVEQQNQKITALSRQFNNLKSYLTKEHIAVIAEELEFTHRKDFDQLSWESGGKETHFASGDDLLLVSQYLEIYNNRMFHLMLSDGSLIRFNYKFEGSRLVEQNLLWWPCPLKDVEFDSSEDIDIIIGGLSKINADELLMRSPIRVDYDCSIDTETHPRCHIHLEHPDARLALNKPLCIYGFMEFIFRNFYSFLKIDYSKWDKLKFEEKPSPIEYKDLLKIR